MFNFDRGLAIHETRFTLLLATLFFGACPMIGSTEEGKICWEESTCQTLSKGDEPPVAVQPRQLRAPRVATDANQAKSKPHASSRSERSARPVRASSLAASTVARVAGQTAHETHKAAIQVAVNDQKVMDLALNNANNMIEYYKAKGENVLIEIVTFGPGLHMVREDTSPVKDRIASMMLANPNIALVACADTQARHGKAEGKPITLVAEAKVTPSGVVRLIELQAKGYAYIRP
jgi:uncharacterized protein